MSQWLDSARERIAGAAGVGPEHLALSEQDVEALLDLARVAAHDSGDRTNAPLVCFLAGVALGRSPEVGLADVAGAASRAAGG